MAENPNIYKQGRGYNDARRNRITQGWCIIYDREYQVAENERFRIECKVHDQHTVAANKVEALYAANKPENWCAGCKDMLWGMLEFRAKSD